MSNSYGPIFPTGGGGGIPTTSQVITRDNETGSLPNSRQLTAGTNISFTTNATELIINASGGSSSIPYNLGTVGEGPVTMVSNTIYFINTNAAQYTLPVAADGDFVVITDIAYNFSSNGPEIIPNGSDTIDGQGDILLQVDGTCLILKYNLANTNWIIQQLVGGVLTTDNGQIVTSGNFSTYLLENANVLPYDGLTIQAVANAPNFTLNTSLGRDLNYLINAQFNYWQRGTSFTIGTAVKTFTADHWYVDTATSPFVGSITVSQVAASTDIGSGALSLYSMSVHTTAYTSGQAYLIQPIENVTTLGSIGNSLSFFFSIAITNSVAVDITIDYVQYFGIGGSSTVVTPVVTGFGIISTGAINIITGKFIPGFFGSATIGTGSAGYLRIYIPKVVGTIVIQNPLIQSGNLNLGTFLATDQVKDLLDCQRYYQTLTTYYNGLGLSTVAQSVEQTFPVPMYATPTAIGTNISASGFPATVGSPTVTNTNIIDTRTSTNVSIGQASYQTNWTLESELTL
jgi:hypothetical protein